jgi:hypothetical protein
MLAMSCPIPMSASGGVSISRFSSSPNVGEEDLPQIDLGVAVVEDSATAQHQETQVRDPGSRLDSGRRR